jgi:hypothetical protein
MTPFANLGRRDSAARKSRFALGQSAWPSVRIKCIMEVFLFRCPNTGLMVQGWVADDPPASDDNTYESITCTACGRLHLINPKTRRVLGGSKDERSRPPE